MLVSRRTFSEVGHLPISENGAVQFRAKWVRLNTVTNILLGAVMEVLGHVFKRRTVAMCFHSGTHHDSKSQFNVAFGSQLLLSQREGLRNVSRRTIQFLFRVNSHLRRHRFHNFVGVRNVGHFQKGRSSPSVNGNRSLVM